MSEQQQSEASVELPGGTKLKARGSDILAGSCLIVSIVAAYALWEHKLDAKADGQSLAAIMKEQTSAIRDSTSAQREMNCLISLPQDRREREFGNENSLCKRLSRER